MTPVAGCVVADRVARNRFKRFEFDLVLRGGRPQAMRLTEDVLLPERPAPAFVVAEREETGTETALEGSGQLRCAPSSGAADGVAYDRFDRSEFDPIRRPTSSISSLQR